MKNIIFIRLKQIYLSHLSTVINRSKICRKMVLDICKNTGKRSHTFIETFFKVEDDF